MIEAFVFDFDGLIIDTEWCEYTSIAEQFARFGLTYEVGHFQQFVGTAWPTGWVDEIESQSVEPIDREALVAQRRARRDELLAEYDVMPGVYALLDVARANGFGLAVASSSSREWVEGHLARLGLRSRFDAVLTRNDVAEAKPAPDLFIAAAAALGVAARASVAFEDSHNGSRAAKAATMTCVVAPNRITEVQDFSHVDLVVPNLMHVELEGLRQLVAANRRVGFGSSPLT